MTEKVWRREYTPRLNLEIHKAAHRKLLLLDWAVHINDLRVPPGNRLEKLAGDRKGQYSIRVNDQYRICFKWSAAGPVDVELTDYH
jgi:proteic killer suppression protein